MRRVIAFPCAGETLIGSLDEATGSTGLLIVSGGNEIRSGAHRGMALLAARLAARGVPVFRYDRRGVGDSSGHNPGYAESRDDLAAAVAAFRAGQPQLTTIAGFGNCDAATALALFGPELGISRLILANPWAIEAQDDLPPAAAIRARYAAKLRDPGAVLKAVTGRVRVRQLFRGLWKVFAKRSQVNPLADRLNAAIAGAPDARIVLARGDATALAFAEASRGQFDAITTIIPTASHSFARTGDAEALEKAIVAALG